MSDTYAKTMKRLISERKKLALSVQQLSNLVNVDQSNWCKIEQEKGRISYKCMKRLCSIDIDMYYVLTGNRNICRSYPELGKCEMSDLVCLLRIIYSVSELRCRDMQCNPWKDIYDNTKYIMLVDTETEVKSLFVNLRKIRRYSQKKLAEILGMDIKKLRNIEKGVRFPDNELIYRLYDIFKISPGIILEDKKCMLNEVCFLLEKMKEVDSEIVIHILDLIKG